MEAEGFPPIYRTQRRLWGAKTGPSQFLMPRPPSRIRVAMADDHVIFLDALRALLSLETDMEIVAQAQDGAGLLEMLNDAQPDILLLDLKMPGLDGLATLHRVQRRQWKTRIIVLTASEDERDYAQAIQLGASGFVLKQQATEVLIEAIRKTFRGEPWTPHSPKRAVRREEPDFPLTEREKQVADLVAQGLMNKEIAEKIFISEETVKNHLHNIFEKLGVSDRLELALYLVRRKLASGQI